MIETTEYKVFVIQNEENKIIGVVKNTTDIELIDTIITAITEHYNAHVMIKDNDLSSDMLRESYAYDGINVNFLISEEGEPSYKEKLKITATTLY